MGFKLYVLHMYLYYNKESDDYRYIPQPPRSAALLPPPLPALRSRFELFAAICEA